MSLVNKLQFLYRGDSLLPIISLSDDEISFSQPELISEDIVELFNKRKLLKKRIVEYEIGRYHHSNQGPLSGATQEETKRAVEFIDHFYSDRRNGQQMALDNQERFFNMASDRLRRIMLLFTKEIGVIPLYDIWIKLVTIHLTGKSKSDILKILGKNES